MRPTSPTLTELLSPADVPAFTQTLPGLGDVVDTCLRSVSAKQQSAGWLRHGLRLTMKEAASIQGCQTAPLRATLARLSHQAMGFRTPGQTATENLFSSLTRPALLDLSGAQSELIPDATPTQLWQFITGLRDAARNNTDRYWTPPDSPPVWPDAPCLTPLLQPVYLQRLPPPATWLQSRLHHEGRFVTPEELASYLNVTSEDLGVLQTFYPFLQPTRSGLYGSAHWTEPQFQAAVRTAFGQLGVPRTDEDLRRSVEVLASAFTNAGKRS